MEEEPAAKVEFSYLDEDHRFDVYEDGRIGYSGPKESLMEEVSEVLGLRDQYDFEAINQTHAEEWIKTWSEKVSSGAPYNPPFGETLTVRVSPDYHDGDSWRDVSWDSFSVKSQRKYGSPSADSIEAVEEMLLEFDQRAQVLHQIAGNRGSELRTLVNSVLEVEPTNTSSAA